MLWMIHMISIPEGAIKRVGVQAQANSAIRFQYPKVRLKASSALGWRRKQKQISIPEGAIKRICGTSLHNIHKVFQYPKVRLKEYFLF